MTPGAAIARRTARQLLNGLRLLRRQSRFKLLVLGLFAVGFELGLAFLFYDAFRFLDAMAGMGTLIVGRLFGLFFMGMGIMLVVSGCISGYASLFRSEELPFLLARPFGLSTIVVYKFLESAFLSSWAFFFIIFPFVGAFTVQQRLPPAFPLWILVFAVPYVLLCAAIGALIVIPLVRWFPASPRARQLALVLLVLTLIVAIRRPVDAAVEDAALRTFSIARLVPGLRLANHPLLPSWWVSEGALDLARGAWGRGGALWAVLATTALVAVLAVEALGRAVFFNAWQRGLGAARATRPLLLAGFARLLRGWRGDTRALLLKDLRIFLRDPQQWSQALIFFGLLGFYFINLRQFRYHLLPDHWRNLIAFLNVFSVSAVMCSLGARFIYPQLSLEGQGLWMLNLAPTTLRRVLLVKFALALTGLLAASLTLMLISTAMLRADLSARLIALGLTVGVAIGVAGLSTGLGAVFLDLRQRNPAAIVSGFGGTLNLVLTLIYMLALIVPFGALFHWHDTGRLGGANLARGLLLLAGPAVGLISLATVAPLAAGARSLARRDY